MLRLGVDIGGTKINLGLFNEKGLLINEKFSVASVTDLPSFIKEKSQELLDKLGYGEIGFVGVGVPGTVSEDGQTIIKVPNLKSIKPDFTKRLKELFVSPVFVLQDSRAAAWGEYKFGGGKGKNSVVCVTLGTGIGTGIVLNGKIFNGALGCAGELGHLPIVENGRDCACGKKGCLESYAAGKGLDYTARIILGDDKTAKDLFKAAREGQSQARRAIKEGIGYLGAALTSIINLLSPDCLLLSGGLSEVDEYALPIIDYIKTHCYQAGALPVIERAKLKDLSPLYGAAYAGEVKRKESRKAYLSASIMCADLMNFGQSLREIKEAGIEYLHCDIMDNHFVPNLMLPTEMLNLVRKESDLPCDFHVMAYNPETIIDRLALKDGDIVSVHYEATPHLQKVVQMIIDKGAKACVAINPATPVEVLSEILPQLSAVLVMTVNPGFAGQKLYDGALKKIEKMKTMLDNRGIDIPIEVDGNCSYENVPKMFEAGADIFVVGTSSVFKKGQTILDGVNKLRASL